MMTEASTRSVRQLASAAAVIPVSAAPVCALSALLALLLLLPGDPASGSPRAQDKAVATELETPSMPDTGFELPRHLVDTVVLAEEAAFDRRYDDALSLFGELERRYPDQPIGLVGQMMVHQARMVENDDLAWDEEFHAAAKQAAKRLRRSDGTPETEAWDHLTSGAYHGLRGLHAVRKRNFLYAARSGLEALDDLKQSKRAAPELADVDFGLGAYLYFRSRIAREAAWLPFSDRTAEGIAQIESATEDGVMVQPLANLALVFVLLGERDHSRSVALARTLLERYPQNVILRIQLARGLLRGGQFDEAIDVLQQVLEIAPENRLAHYYLGQVRYVQGTDLRAAERDLTEFLERAPTANWRSEGLERLGDVLARRGDQAAARELWVQARAENRGNKTLHSKLKGQSKLKGKSQ